MDRHKLAGYGWKSVLIPVHTVYRNNALHVAGTEFLTSQQIVTVQFCVNPGRYVCVTRDTSGSYAQISEKFPCTCERKALHCAEVRSPVHKTL